MAAPWGLLFFAALLLPASAGAQATLNKCIDARGSVTYSNLPCKNAREVQRIEIDPAPPVPPAPSPAQAKPEPAAPAPVTRSAPSTPAPAPVLKAGSTAPAAPAAPLVRPSRAPSPTAAPALGASQQCERLSAQLGDVLDKMDQARRKGAGAEQIDAWNRQIRELERKKQQTGCF